MFTQKVKLEKTGEDWSDKLVNKGLPILGAVAGGVIGSKAGPTGAVGGAQAGQQLGSALGGLISDDPYSTAKTQQSLYGATGAVDRAYEAYLRRKDKEAQTNLNVGQPQQPNLSPVNMPMVPSLEGPSPIDEYKFGANFGSLPYPTRARFG